MKTGEVISFADLQINPTLRTLFSQQQFLIGARKRATVDKLAS